MLLKYHPAITVSNLDVPRTQIFTDLKKVPQELMDSVKEAYKEVERVRGMIYLLCLHTDSEGLCANQKIDLSKNVY